MVTDVKDLETGGNQIRNGGRASQDAVPAGPAGIAGQVVFYLLILALLVGAFAMTFWFDEVPPPLKRGMAPETFPRAVILLAGALTMWSLLREWRMGGGRKPVLTREFQISLVASAAFLLVAFLVDFLLAMAAFTAVITWSWGNRRPLVVALMAIVLPAILFVLFSELLGVRFPRGVIVNLIYG